MPGNGEGLIYRRSGCGIVAGGPLNCLPAWVMRVNQGSGGVAAVEADSIRRLLNNR